MPYVPAGCLLHLEEQAREHVLDNIRSATASLRGEKLLNELRLLRGQKKDEITLQHMVDFLHLDTPDEIYKRGLPHMLLAKADRKPPGDDLVELDKHLAKGFRRIALWDDTQLINNAKRLIETGTSDAPLTR